MKVLAILKVGLGITAMLIGGIAVPIVDVYLKKDKNKEKIKAIDEELKRLHELAKQEVEANRKVSFNTECRITELVKELRDL